jgi:hypothetical protein
MVYKHLPQDRELSEQILIHAGVPDAIAAAWMGHTVDVHNKQY